MNDGRAPDPKGVFDRPDTTKLQRGVDELRRMLVGQHPIKVRDATVRMGADMLELTIDWLSDQHRVMTEQAALIDDQNKLIGEQLAMINRLQPGT